MGELGDDDAPVDEAADEVDVTDDPDVVRTGGGGRAIFGGGGVGISTLSQIDDSPQDARLFEDRRDTRAKAEAATDAIRKKFGKDAIQRGRALR